MHHLAAAAAMGRAHHIARREGQRSRSTTHGHSQYMVFSPSGDVAPTGTVSGSTAHRGGETEQVPIATGASPSTPLTVTGEEASQHGPVLPSVRTDSTPAQASGSRTFASNRRGFSFNNTYAILIKLDF